MTELLIRHMGKFIPALSSAVTLLRIRAALLPTPSLELALERGSIKSALECQCRCGHNKDIQ